MPSSELRAFVVRVVAVFALVACAWMIWTLSDLLLMVFGAIVVAVLLRALSSWVTRRRRVSDSWVLALVVTVLTVGFTALLWLFGSQLASEVGALQRASLQAWTRVHDWLAAGPLGPALEELTRQAPARVSNLAPRAGAFAPSITGGMANLFLVLAGAGIWQRSRGRIGAACCCCRRVCAPHRRCIAGQRHRVAAVAMRPAMPATVAIGARWSRR